MPSNVLVEGGYNHFFLLFVLFVPFVPFVVKKMQLLHNLYQLSGDMNGLTHAGKDAAYEDANTYALNTPQGIILFDCGCGDTLEQIFQRMHYWNLDPKNIRACLLTHPHLDHAGAAHLLKKRDIPIYAHQETANAIAKADLRCAGYLYHKTFQPCQTDHTLTDNQTLTLLDQTIQVHHLPGHSQGCTAYLFTHENKRILISGDIIGTLLAGDFGWSGSIDFNKTNYLQSLKRLAQIHTDIMLPGHGMPYFHKPQRRVQQVLNAALMQWR